MVIVEAGDPKGEDSRGGDAAKAKAKAKKALVGAGARVLFYPTLFYNVVRNKVEAEFHWWDEVDQFILLGAVPFPADVPRLQQLGVRGVITLNEPYETLVPSSLYKVHGIEHLVIPTRDYLFAPSLADICRAVDFIHGNASRGRTTYVHCKAGRGRSTTIVLCYLVEYKNMTPTAALEYVRSRRPRVLLAPSQWRAVEEYSRRKLQFPALQSPRSKQFFFEEKRSKQLLTGDEVFMSEADFEDYSMVEYDETTQEGPIGGDGVLTGDGVLISETDFEDYCMVEYDDETTPMIMNHVQEGLIGGDEVLTGDEVFISETDLEGYSIVEQEETSPVIVNHAQEDGDLTGDEVLISDADLDDHPIVENKDSSPVISNHVQDPVGGDEIMVTDTDLEGHETFMNGSHERNHAEKKTAAAGNSVRWLSCICTSFKFSPSSQIQACWALRTSTIMKAPVAAVRCD